MNNNILIIINNALGDFINFLPFLENIQINYPDSKITLITKKRYFELLNYSKIKNIQKLIDYDNIPIYKLFSKKFQLDNNLIFFKNFSLIIAFTGKKDETFIKNLKIINKNSFFIFPINFNQNIHEALYLINSFPFRRKYLKKPELILPESKKEYIAIHPGSGDKRKNLDINFFIDLSRKLNFPVKFFGGENEYFLENRIDITICSSIKEAVDILKKAYFYIGCDSGISHLSSAFNILSFVFFGPTSIKIWKPLGENCIVFTKNYKCSPCEFNCEKGFQCLDFNPVECGKLILNIYKNSLN